MCLLISLCEKIQPAAAGCSMLQNPNQRILKSRAAACCGMLRPLVVGSNRASVCQIMFSESAFPSVHSWGEGQGPLLPSPLYQISCGLSGCGSANIQPGSRPCAWT